MISQEDSQESLITDRPDATESPSTVPLGFIQVETGAFFESYKATNKDLKSYTFNTTLLRLGLLNNIELRLGWDFTETHFTNNNDLSSGLNPLLLGAKFAIIKDKMNWPEIGVLAHVYLPFIAGNDYKTDNTGKDILFAVAHTLNDKSSLSYNLGIGWDGDASEAKYLYSLSYGYAITTKLGMYAEIYGDLPVNDKANHYWDTGFTYLLSNNVQLDATVGSGITDGQKLLFSGGISFRLPTWRN